MDLPIVTDIFYYATEAALIQLESLKVIIQVAASDYSVEEINYSNEYLLYFHMLLVQHNTGLLQDHSM